MSWKKILKEDKKLRCEIKRSPNCTGKAELHVFDMRRFSDDNFRPNEPSGGYSCKYCAFPLEDRGFEDMYEEVSEIDEKGKPISRPLDVSEYTND